MYNGIIAGVGYPQLSAIYNISKALKGSGIPVIADGGVKHTGDITKAIAAGADCVMLGSLLAGTHESPGETIIYEEENLKRTEGWALLKLWKKEVKKDIFNHQLRIKISSFRKV